MTWKNLLDTPDGPDGLHAQMLQPLIKRADQPAFAEIVLARSDDPLAAIAVLQGAAGARPFASAAVAAIARVGRRLGASPAGVNPLSRLMLLSMSSIVETVGVTMPAPSFDPDEQLTGLLVGKGLSTPDRVTLVLIAMARGRHVDLRSLMSARDAAMGAGAPIALLQALASPAGAALAETWDGFVCDFPAALEAGVVEWRHLLLAARIVFTRLGRAEIGEVAQALHRQVVELAAA